MKRILFIFGVLVLLTSHNLFSQLKISGVVLDSFGNALPGVNVILKGTTIGTLTNFEGEFTVTIPDSLSVKPVLLISFIGMKTEEITIDGKSEKRIQLVEEKLSLDEVVVVGYGIKRESKSLAYSVADAPARSKRKSSGIKIRGVSSISKSKGRHVSEALPKTEFATHETGQSITPEAGLLTAGEIHDFSKWKLWQDIAKKDLKQWQKFWKINPLERHCIQLQTEQGSPVADAEVALINEQGDTIWLAKTDNTGKAELWGEIFGNESNKKQKFNVLVSYNRNTFKIKRAKEFHKKVNILKIPAVCDRPADIDIAFVVDATGSMGDEIQYLKTELNDIIAKIKDTLPDYQINLGSVFYRDKGDAYITKHIDLSAETDKTINFISENYAGGGGDTPEAVDSALAVAIDKLSWSKYAVSRLLFLILDAPPHSDEATKQKIRNLTKRAAQKGIRIIPLTCSGIDKSTEYLMRCCALATNGTYVFLTDDSGIGNPHIKPTTDSYEVELLNDLIVRLAVNFSKMPDCHLEVYSDSLNTSKTEIKHQTDSLSIDSTSVTSEINSEGNETKGEGFKWKYYPNPTSGKITIESDEKIDDIFICDISGKIIKRIVIYDQKKFKVDLSEFPNGIYFIRFKPEGKSTITGKLILQHR